MVARDLLLAQPTGARCHIAHISTRNAVAMVAYARSQGLAATCEATPHHFTLSDRDMAAYDSNYKMKPPLRGPGDRAAVSGRPRFGSYRRDRHGSRAASRQRKNAGVRALPFGIIGLETAVALALEELVRAGKIALSRMVELFTTGPERVLRLGRGRWPPARRAT